MTQIELGDHITADMAVMFSDIRQFTSLAEKKCSPQEIFDLVNAYLPADVAGNSVPPGVCG